MTDLTRFLWFCARYPWRTTGRATTAVQSAALALAPLYFTNGQYTGLPNTLTMSYLAQRGIGERSFQRGYSATRSGNGSRIIRELVETHGILREEQREGVLRIHRVHHLEPDHRWQWPPNAYGDVERDWVIIGTPRAWDGEDAVVHELRPLFLSRPEVGLSPANISAKHFVAISRELIDRYGLDTFRQAVASAIADPSSVTPFTAIRFRDVFYGLVQRWRRANGFGAVPHFDASP